MAPGSKHKAGFVNILGNPNVGRSTLMNALVGERLSIIASGAQTTRHRIMGIVNGDDYQIVYSDTPGIIKPAYKLQESMMKYISNAMQDADVFIYMTDVMDNPMKNKDYIDQLSQTDVPVLLLINKIDQSDNNTIQQLISHWNELLPTAEIIALSALKKFNIERVLNRIVELLPESPPYFPKDELTDRPVRFFVSEIIREKIFTNYKKEIPYSVEVEIEQYKETDKRDEIRAVIHVIRESHKGIIIGKGGEALKKVGIQARKEIEVFVGKSVFLELFVKVSKDWKDKPGRLNDFGYS
jgi:GTP-binding protein Era